MQTLRVRRLAALLLAFSPLFWLSSRRIVESLNYQDSDYFQFWLAARMTWHGQNPYDPTLWEEEHHLHGGAWMPDSTFIYPLPTSVLLAPLGLLPLFESYALWVFLSLLAIFCSLLLLGTLCSSQEATLNYMAPMIAGAFLFRPVIVTILNGQLGALLLLLLVMAMKLWRNERWLGGGALVGFTLLKPSLGIPIAILVGLWATLQRRWRVIAGLALASAVLLAIGLLRNPIWPIQYIPIATQKASQTLGHAPSLWGLAGLACKDDPDCLIISGWTLTALVSLILLAFFQTWKLILDPAAAIALAACGALLALPYLWAYDQILLLIPTFVLSLGMRDRGAPYITTVGLPLMISLLSLILLYVAFVVGRDAWSAALSLLLLIGILWLQSSKRRDAYTRMCNIAEDNNKRRS